MLLDHLVSGKKRAHSGSIISVIESHVTWIILYFVVFCGRSDMSITFHIVSIISYLKQIINKLTLALPVTPGSYWGGGYSETSNLYVRITF